MTTVDNQDCNDLDNNEIQQPLSMAVSVEYEASETSVAMEETATEHLPTVRGGDDSLAEDLEPFSDNNENEPVELGDSLELEQSEQENSEENVADGDANEPQTVEESFESESEKKDQYLPGEEEQGVNGSETETALARKRRGRPLGRLNSLPSLKRAKTEAGVFDDISWEDLMGHIQCRLNTMDSDECFVKAMEIAMLARSEVESRSQHLLNAFDMMSRGNSTSVPMPPPPPPAANTVPNVAAVPAASQDTLERWMAKYLELKQFQRLNGHCNVPFNQPSYEVLAKWTLFQKHHQSNLNSTQRHLLNSIKFQWGDETKNDDAMTKETLDITVVKDEKVASAKELKAQVNQTKAEKEFSKQKQVKMHRTTKFRTVESVPCIKMEPPLPPKCESDEASILAEVPMFSSLANFPNARYFGNCVMCDESEFPVPKQNKGVCNNCDTAVWVFAETGLQIKWCKGCKNFKKWLDFGAKGYSSKCQSCRSLQAHRYAMSKKKSDTENQDKR